MRNKNLIIYSILLNAALLLTLIIVLLKKPDIKEVRITDDILAKKVERLEKENIDLLYNIKSLNDSIDVIKKKKRKIKYIYREKIKFINSANSDQLDSTIRANW
jgi:hypothetical protein